MTKTKIIAIFMIILCIVSVTSNVFADFDGEKIKSTAKSFVDEGKMENTLDADNVNNFVSSISSILMGIGLAVVMIVGLILGIKYVTESAAGKAKIQDSLVPFIIGVVIIFGAYGFWKIAINIANKIE